MISAERQHCHRIATYDAYRACRRSGRFGSHNATDENAVVPTSGLIYKRSGCRATSAENDCADGHAVGSLEFTADARAVDCGCGETAVGVRRFDGFAVGVFHIGRPGIAFPVDKACRRCFGKTFPPHGVIFGIDCNVRENGILSCGSKSVGVRLFVRTGSDAEEARLGVDCVKSAVRTYAKPRDVVADRINAIAFLV